MKLYGAIDLHSTNNVTAVINEQDQVVYQKRFPNDLSLIVQQLSGYQTSLEGIVVESTYNWYWLAARGRSAIFTKRTGSVRSGDSGRKYSQNESSAPMRGQLVAP